MIETLLHCRLVTTDAIRPQAVFELRDPVLVNVQPDRAQQAGDPQHADLHPNGGGAHVYGVPRHGYHSAAQHAHSYDVQLLPGDRGQCLAPAVYVRIISCFMKCLGNPLNAGIECWFLKGLFLNSRK